MPTLIPAGGETTPLDIPPFPASVKALQAAVGGFFEVVDLFDGRYLVIADHGLQRCLLFNRRATCLARPIMGPGNRVLGTALLISDDEMDLIAAGEMAEAETA